VQLPKKNREFDPDALLAVIGEGRKALLFPKKRTIFAQGSPADAVFYLQTGKVKLGQILRDEVSLEVPSDGVYEALP